MNWLKPLTTRHIRRSGLAVLTVITAALLVGNLAPTPGVSATAAPPELTAPLPLTGAPASRPVDDPGAAPEIAAVPGVAELASGAAPSRAAEPSGLPTDDVVQVSASPLVMQGQIRSTVLGEEKPYLVYLPPGYRAGLERYPVLYMLHGMGGDYQEWYEQGLFNDAERLISEGAIRPFIIVTPQGDQSYWINWADGGPRYTDYVLQDVVPAIDAAYRTIPEPGARAVGGLSMGATGALQMAFKHPGIFGSVGGHSPTLRTEETALPYMGTGAFFRSQDPISLARTLDGLQTLRIWLDCGDQDEWRSRVEELHGVLAERRISHEFRVLSGPHEREYWEQWQPLYLRFYSSAFREG